MVKQIDRSSIIEENGSKQIYIITFKYKLIKSVVFTPFCFEQFNRRVIKNESWSVHFHPVPNFLYQGIFRGNLWRFSHLSVEKSRSINNVYYYMPQRKRSFCANNS